MNSSEKKLKIKKEGSISLSKNQKKAKTSSKKIKELEEKLNKAERDYLYLKADFENYKKQTLKEKKELIQGAEKHFILSLVEEFIDDFERAFEVCEREGSLSDFKTGAGMVYKKLKKLLERFGVEAIDPTGTPFDPSQHEAINRQKHPSIPADHIIVTFKKVYKFYNRVIRYGQVVVSEGPPEEES